MHGLYVWCAYMMCVHDYCIHVIVSLCVYDLFMFVQIIWLNLWY